MPEQHVAILYLSRRVWSITNTRYQVTILPLHHGYLQGLYFWVAKAQRMKPQPTPVYFKAYPTNPSMNFVKWIPSMSHCPFFLQKVPYHEVSLFISTELLFWLFITIWEYELAKLKQVLRNFERTSAELLKILRWSVRIQNH